MLESLTDAELEFIGAIETYKNQKKKLFLSWTEVLDILKGLGYKRPADLPYCLDNNPLKARLGGTNG